MKNISAVILLFACLLQSFTPVAQTRSTALRMTGTKTDGKTVANLMAANMYELQLLKLAVAKGQSQELKAAAIKMIEDHKRMDAKLTAFANRENFGTNSEKRDKYAEKIAKWSGRQSGAALDKDLIEELVDLHKDAIDLLQDNKSEIKDDAMKELTEQSVAILRSHLDVLLPLKGQIKDGNTTAAADNALVDAVVAAHVGDVPEGNEKDAKFLSDLMATNFYELQLMEEILRKGNNRDLKNAAQSMMEDHQQLAERTRTYAREKKYGIDPEKGNKYADKIEKWTSKKGGMEWDADMIEELIDIHKDGIDMLEDAVNDVHDGALKLLLTEALSPMKMHLQMLEPLKEKVKKPWKNK